MIMTKKQRGLRSWKKYRNLTEPDVVDSEDLWNFDREYLIRQRDNVLDTLKMHKIDEAVCEKGFWEAVDELKERLPYDSLLCHWGTQYEQAVENMESERDPDRVNRYKAVGVQALEFKFSSHSDCCDFSAAMGDPADYGEEVDGEECDWTWGLSIVDIYDPGHVFDKGVEHARIPIHEMQRHDEGATLWLSPGEGVWEFWCKAIEKKAEQFGPVEIRECMFDFDVEEFDCYTDQKGAE